MTIKLRQEIEVWYIIPAIRREIASGLLKKGLRQRQIAQKLEVTDAAISQYFKSKRGSEVKFNERLRQEIGQSVERISEGKSVMKEIQRLCRLCHEDGLCCYVHKRHGAPNECDACCKD